LCAQGKIAINLRGSELLQTVPGEDEESAWRRLRSKLSYTGRQLHEVLLMQPSAVPTTGGTAPPTNVPPLGSGGGGDLLGGPSTPRSPPPGGDTSGGGIAQPPGGGIFDGGSSASGKPRIALSNPPTSSLNLIGKLEIWGIGPATPVAEVSIKLSSATGSQLRELLKKLPDGMTFGLSLEKEEK
jgi:hypothetical protein